MARFVRGNSWLFNPIWKIYFPLFHRTQHHFIGYGGDMQAVFRKIYAENLWFTKESRSGTGSTLHYTKRLRRDLARIIKDHGIKSILDAPCGDFNWMNQVDLSDVSYIGADIVPELIADLSERYSRPNREFRILDIVTGEIPTVDLWICRDVLFHLPGKDGVTVLKQAANANVKFFFASSHPFVRENFEVEYGGFRHINLKLPPFSLPEPILAVEDFIIPSAPRVMALWTGEQLKRWAAAQGGNAATSSQPRMKETVETP